MCFSWIFSICVRNWSSRFAFSFNLELSLCGEPFPVLEPPEWTPKAKKLREAEMNRLKSMTDPEVMARQEYYKQIKANQALSAKSSSTTQSGISNV